MSVAYCEKYPERVERLILISPAGVPDDEGIDVQGRFQNASFGTKALIRVVSSLFHRGITPAAFLRNLLESPRNTFGGDCPPSPLPTSRNDWGSTCTPMRRFRRVERIV